MATSSEASIKLTDVVMKGRDGFSGLKGTTAEPLLQEKTGASTQQNGTGEPTQQNGTGAPTQQNGTGAPAPQNEDQPTSNIQTFLLSVPVPSQDKRINLELPQDPALLEKALADEMEDIYILYGSEGIKALGDTISDPDGQPYVLPYQIPVYRAYIKISNEIEQRAQTSCEALQKIAAKLAIERLDSSIDEILEETVKYFKDTDTKEKAMALFARDPVTCGFKSNADGGEAEDMIKALMELGRLRGDLTTVRNKKENRMKELISGGNLDARAANLPRGSQEMLFLKHKDLGQMEAKIDSISKEYAESLIRYAILYPILHKIHSTERLPVYPDGTVSFASMPENGKEDSGKENSGKENSGKEDSGKKDFGKEDSGKENYTKENYTKENYGKEDYKSKFILFQCEVHGVLRSAWACAEAIRKSIGENPEEVWAYRPIIEEALDHPEGFDPLFTERAAEEKMKEADVREYVDIAAFLAGGAEIAAAAASPAPPVAAVIATVSAVLGVASLVLEGYEKYKESRAFQSSLDPVKSLGADQTWGMFLVMTALQVSGLKQLKQAAGAAKLLR